MNFATEIMPTVLQVVPCEDFTVEVYFSDGKITKYDARGFVEFNHLGVNRDNFAAAMTVLNGTLAWDLEGNFDPTKCVDLDPCTLYDQPQIDQPTAAAWRYEHGAE